MRAELKRVHSPDTDDLKNYRPEDPEKFSLLLQAMVGLEGTEGEESFDIEVCTPNWIKSQYADEKYVWGRHMLIVLEYDLDLIKRQIEGYIAGCTGEDWLTIARKLSRMGAWEFEDYQP